jgi:hypothetical protein
MKMMAASTGTLVAAAKNNYGAPAHDLIHPPQQPPTAHEQGPSEPPASQQAEQEPPLCPLWKTELCPSIVSKGKVRGHRCQLLCLHADAPWSCHFAHDVTEVRPHSANGPCPPGRPVSHGSIVDILASPQQSQQHHVAAITPSTGCRDATDPLPLPSQPPSSPFPHTPNPQLRRPRGCTRKHLPCRSHFPKKGGMCPRPNKCPYGHEGVRRYPGDLLKDLPPEKVRSHSTSQAGPV